MKRASLCAAKQAYPREHKVIHGPDAASQAMGKDSTHRARKRMDKAHLRRAAIPVVSRVLHGPSFGLALARGQVRSKPLAQFVAGTGQKRLDSGWRPAHHLANLGVAHVLELVEQDSHPLIFAEDVERFSNDLGELDLPHLG